MKRADSADLLGSSEVPIIIGNRNRSNSGTYSTSVRTCSAVPTAHVYLHVHTHADPPDYDVENLEADQLESLLKREAKRFFEKVTFFLTCIICFHHLFIFIILYSIVIEK